MAFKHEYKQRMYQRRKDLIDVIRLASGCLDCGVPGPAVVLTFDHVRGTKCFNIGSRWDVSVDKFNEELAKCEVVCFNCHMIREERRRANRA